MLNNLTGLRFYAALWVFLLHSLGYVKELDFLFLQKGYIGVDLFFILSGFILAYVYYNSFFAESITFKKYWNFIVKRFAKIYPMHIISFFMIAVYLYVGRYVFNKEDFQIVTKDIPAILLMVHSWYVNGYYGWNIPSWSLSSEWFAYLFVFAPFSVLFKSGKKIFISVILIIVFFFLYKWNTTRDFTFDPDKLTNFGLERLFPEFILGMMLGYLRLEVHISKAISTVLFVLSLAVLAVLLFGNTGLSFDALCVIPLSMIIFSLSYHTYIDFLFSNKVFIYLGNISFTFYILQLITFYALKKPIEWFNMQSLPIFPLVFLKVIILVGFNLMLAAVFYKYFEEPARKLIVKKLLKD